MNVFYQFLEVLKITFNKVNRFKASGRVSGVPKIVNRNIACIQILIIWFPKNINSTKRNNFTPFLTASLQQKVMQIKFESLLA